MKMFKIYFLEHLINPEHKLFGAKELIYLFPNIVQKENKIKKSMSMSNLEQFHEKNVNK